MLLRYVDQQTAEQIAQDAIQQAVSELQAWVTAHTWPGESSFDKLAWRRIWQRCIDGLRKWYGRSGKGSPLPPGQAGSQPIGFLAVESCIEQLAMVSAQLGGLDCEESQQTLDIWIAYLQRLLAEQTVQHFAPEDLWEAVADVLSLAEDDIDQRREQGCVPPFTHVVAQAFEGLAL